MPRKWICAMTLIATLALTPSTATAGDRSGFGRQEIDAIVTDYLDDTAIPGATVAKWA